MNDEARLARIETTVEGIQRTVGKIERHMLGNGREGMLTRVDRLEQAEAVRRNHVRALWATLLGVLGTIAASWFTGGGR